MAGPRWLWRGGKWYCDDGDGPSYRGEKGGGGGKVRASGQSLGPADTGNGGASTSAELDAAFADKEKELRAITVLEKQLAQSKADKARPSWTSRRRSRSPSRSRIRSWPI